MLAKVRPVLVSIDHAVSHTHALPVSQTATPSSTLPASSASTLVQASLRLSPSTSLPSPLPLLMLTVSSTVESHVQHCVSHHCCGLAQVCCRCRLASGSLWWRSLCTPSRSERTQRHSVEVLAVLGLAMHGMCWKVLSHNVRTRKKIAPKMISIR